MPRVRRCRQPHCHAMVPFPNHYCVQHIEHEAEYLASRQKWARSHEQQYSHKYNTRTRKRTEQKVEQYAFYRTREWAGLRHQVLDRDYYLCQYCLVRGVTTPAKTVDHVVPVEFDDVLKTNIDNLATICPACHRLKTDWEKSYYGTGQGNSLARVDEVHEINTIAYLLNAL